jgi:GxxExxY protein
MGIGVKESGMDTPEGNEEHYPEKELTERIIGAAMAVHEALGPGLLESTYESCLARELELTGIQFKRQLELPIEYRGTLVDCASRIDLLIEDSVILELKSAERLLPIHEAQLLSYLKLSGKKSAFSSTSMSRS